MSGPVRRSSVESSCVRGFAFRFRQPPKLIGGHLISCMFQLGMDDDRNTNTDDGRHAVSSTRCGTWESFLKNAGRTVPGGRKDNTECDLGKRNDHKCRMSNAECLRGALFELRLVILRHSSRDIHKRFDSVHRLLIVSGGEQTLTATISGNVSPSKFCHFIARCIGSTRSTTLPS